ncbi:MAG: hypothetical protein M3416_00810 [Acidobacteriota bacterium]|nr:hypothetical protein [Acidobacteriota bacterium]
MSKVLLPWLDSADQDTHQLSRWLQGYDLPAIGSDDEPYVWLLYGLPPGGDYHLRETQLAERTARLINERPDVLRPGDMPERLLYNLLSLCSGLSAPDQLAEPLYAMYERRALEGQWLGVELYDALLSALVPNQVDDRLAGVWRRMLDGEEPEPLRGNMYDGFEGILWMPKSRLTRGEPDLGSLGHALWVMSRHLDGTPHCRLEFTSLLDKVQEIYFGHPTWKTDLLNLAHKYNWVRWAVECLPDLSFVVEEVEPALDRHAGGEKITRLIVWWPFTKVLEAGAAAADFRFKTEKSFCDKQVFQVILPQREMQFIVGLASFVEPYRIYNPFPSPASVVGNIADAMSAYEDKLGRDDQRSQILERVHRDILEEGRIYSFKD